MQLTKFNISKSLTYSILVLSLLIFSSCSMEEDEYSNFVPELFTYKTQSENSSYKNCDVSSDTCTFISISYPIFLNQNENEALVNIQEKINEIILGSQTDNAKLTCDLFIEDYDEFIHDSQIMDEDYSTAWYDVREAEILTVKKRVVSVKCKIRSFYGGAHPNEYVYLRNFNSLNGDSLGLSMIFSPESLLELTNLAERKFRKDKNLSSKISLETEGYWFDNNTFELSTNFAFTDHGLWFYYNEYDIGPYSLGHTEIVLSYNLIAHLFE